VRDGDDYVLNGSKYWITNSGVSETYTVFASTNPRRAVTASLVSWWRRAGCRVSQSTRTNSDYGVAHGEVVFNDLRVPASHRIGAEGDGFKIAMHTLDRSRPTIGAQAVGIAQASMTTRVST